jgi:predicted DNA-binding transcriptional regulator AlpA
MRLLDRKQLLEKVPMSFQKVWELMRRGEFPAAREIGTKAVWLESEVDAWVLELPKRAYKAPSETEVA